MNLLLNTIISLEEELSQQDFVQQVAALDLPIAGIELRYEYFPETKDERQAVFQEFLETGKHKDWQTFLSIPLPLFTTNGLHPDLELFLREAEQLNVRSVKMNIGDLTGISQVKTSELTALLDSYQINLTIENDQTEENGHYGPVKTALTAIEEQGLPVGYTFDLGNWLVMEEDPYQAFNALKPYITVFHMKNLQDKQTTLLEEGALDWRKFLGLPVPYVLEYPMTVAQIPGEVAKMKEAEQRG